MSFVQRAWTPKAKTGSFVGSTSVSTNPQQKEVALGDHILVHGMCFHIPAPSLVQTKLVCILG